MIKVVLFLGQLFYLFGASTAGGEYEGQQQGQQDQSSVYRCGPSGNNRRCPESYCCSNYGWCGNTSDFCSVANCNPSYGSCVGQQSTTTEMTSYPTETSIYTVPTSYPAGTETETETATATATATVTETATETETVSSTYSVPTVTPTVVPIVTVPATSTATYTSPATSVPSESETATATSSYCPTTTTPVPMTTTSTAGTSAAAPTGLTIVIPPIQSIPQISLPPLPTAVTIPGLNLGNITGLCSGSGTATVTTTATTTCTVTVTKVKTKTLMQCSTQTTPSYTDWPRPTSYPQTTQGYGG